MGSAHDMDRQLEDFARHLAQRQKQVLAAWRTAVTQDPALHTASSLSKARFDDHIPEVLDAFAAQLKAWPGKGVAVAEDQQQHAGERHGAVRWQQGYDLREVAGEWKQLQLVLLDEMQRYARERPGLEAEMLAYVQRSLVILCAEGVEHSIAEYVRLQQTAAAGRVRDLEAALGHLQQLQRQRSDVWRQAAHDLRDNVGMVSTATVVLNHPAVTDSMRNQSLQTLEKGVSALRALLNDLLSLARLEAGQERRAVAAFDASDLLETLCENARPLAAERGLYLRVEGAKLLVQGDAVKVQRIAQNLLMNALKYTREGGVTVAWGPRPENRVGQWFLRVSDTGPGVEASRPPIVQELKAITEDVRANGATDRTASQTSAGEAENGLRPAAGNLNGPASTQGALTQGPGEGVGLSIVKQLCELLDATLELESTPANGTTIRVLLPAHYETN